MSLIVEDGTGKADAESYGSVADADAYHRSRYGPDASWANYSAGEKELFLRRATDYMLATYRGKWKGWVSIFTQRLDWPRYEVYPDASNPYALAVNIVPDAVKWACFELALRAATQSLVADEDPNTVIAESIGPISVTYAQGGAKQIRFAQVDRMLGTLLTGGSNAIQVTAVRA